MRIFILGYTGSGKTTLAKNICAQRGGTHVEASDTVRSLWPLPPGLPPESYTQYLTDKSTEALARDPDFVLREIRSRVESLTGEVVISGIRNPRDFAALYREGDRVVLLEVPGVTPKTEFERNGVQEILQYLAKLGSTPLVAWRVGNPNPTVFAAGIVGKL